MIHLETFNKKQLQEFVTTKKHEVYEFLPITEHRAFSQIKNPRANNDDVLLTLAFEGEKLAGYLGTLPDEIYTDNEKIKFAWLSTLYVSENFRGKKIAQQLLDKVFEGYQNKIGITEFTKEAESLYQKTQKFEYINPKNGKRYYFRSDLETFLPLKKHSFKTLKPLLKLIDFSINISKSIFVKSNKKLEFKYKIEKNIDEESKNFIYNFQKNSSCRTSEELNWILENPWVLEDKNGTDNYLFSSFANEFQYYVVKIYDENTLCDLSILQLRDGHLKIPYLFIKNDYKNFTEFLNKFISEKKVKMLTSYHLAFNNYVLKEKSFSFLHLKNFERRYFVSKDLLKVLPVGYVFNFQDGDGDCVFT